MELQNSQDNRQVTVRCRDLHLDRDIYLVAAASLSEHSKDGRENVGVGSGKS